MKNNKILDLVKRDDVVFFNFLDQKHIISRPMTIHDVKDGKIYLLTSRNSELFHLLEYIKIANLTLTKEDTYLVFNGKFSWNQDKDLIDTYWDATAERLLKLPKDDSSISIIVFEVESIRYWGEASGVMQMI